MYNVQFKNCQEQNWHIFQSHLAKKRKFWQVLKQSRLNICKEQQPPSWITCNWISKSGSAIFQWQFQLCTRFTITLFSFVPIRSGSCFSSAAAAMFSYQHQCQVNWTFFVSSPNLGAEQAVEIILFMVISFLMLHRVGAILKSTFRTEMKDKSCCHKLGSDARGVYISYE